MERSIILSNFSKPKFPVIGIGSSAGGIKALKEFFSNLPEDRDLQLSFVLVQHLSPDHESTLDEILSRYTGKKVYQVWENNNGIKIEPDTIYIIPPNRYLTIEEDKLILKEPEEFQDIRFPIDTFFYSLAECLKERAICTVLSGTGTDGIKGVEAVKDHNGMVMVQDPKTAEHGNMPYEAINTGLVDYILKPEEMPAQLISFVKYALKINKDISPSIQDDKSEYLQEIFRLLQVQVGHDFSGYKINTINRRIEHRMAVRQIDSLEKYLKYLENNYTEIKALLKNFLVGVTSFFRDPKTFETLKETVTPDLFKDKQAGDPIRVWVPGCSTGEEAYSIAILLKEEIEKLNQYYKVYIFATDIDENAIEKARLGSYPSSIATNISEERLTRFFIYNFENDAYQVKEEIREMLIFAEQNVIQDPPFTKLNLICCRNLLIFLKPEIQKKVLHLFHYALKKSGYLLLGRSETANELSELFTTIDKENKIYQKKDSVNYPRYLPQGITSTLRDGIKFSRPTQWKEEKTSLRSLAEKMLLRQHTPASVIVNEQGEILYIHGRTGKFLEPSSGKASMNIFHMARKGLNLELGEAIHKATDENKNTSYYGLKVKSNGETNIVNLKVQPVSNSYSVGQGLIMVVFEEVASLEALDISQGEKAATSEELVNKDRKIAELERELREKEEYLQTTIEELGTYNEELQSLNEEYQSTNEELETSKEELQSINEELTSVNRELQEKIEELREANNDMNNMLAGTGVGTIFLDESKCIKRFTPQAKKVFNLRDGDVGRPISDITSNLVKYNTLEVDIQYVLDTLEKVEKEVQGKDQTWYLMRVLPYRTMEHAVEGVVVNLIDITEFKQLETTEKRLAVVVRDSNDAITIQNFEGEILAWNKMAEKFYGWTESEALQMNIKELIPEEKIDEAISKLKRLALDEEIKPYQTKRITKTGKELKVYLTATALIDHYGKPYAVATTERIISNKK